MINLLMIRRKTVTKLRIFGVSFLCLALCGCNDISSSQGDERSKASGDFDYARDNAADEFSSIVKSVASASFPRKGLTIDVQISCERNEKKAEKTRLILSAVMTRKKDSQVIQDTSAILYKFDDHDPKIYKDNLFNGVSPNGNIEMDWNRFDFTSDSIPRTLNVRFVFGATPLDVELSDIDQLSELPKIDLKIPVSTSNVGKVVSDCVPR